MNTKTEANISTEIINTISNAEGYVTGGIMTSYLLSEGDTNTTAIDQNNIAEDEKLTINKITYSSGVESITIDITINQINYSGELKIVKPEGKSAYLVIETLSDKIQIGTVITNLGGKKITIDETNIEQYNKRKLVFTELDISENGGEEVIRSISADGIIDDTNIGTENIESKKGFYKYIVGALLGSGLTIGAQNIDFNEASKTYDSYIIDRSPQNSDSLSDFINSTNLPSELVLNNEKTLIELLRNNNIEFDNKGFTNDKIYKGNTFITTFENNKLVCLTGKNSGNIYYKSNGFKGKCN